MHCKKTVPAPALKRRMVKLGAFSLNPRFIAYRSRFCSGRSIWNLQGSRPPSGGSYDSATWTLRSAEQRQAASCPWLWRGGFPLASKNRSRLSVTSGQWYAATVVLAKERLVKNRLASRLQKSRKRNSHSSAITADRRSPTSISRTKRRQRKGRQFAIIA
jgi:hypothetical protein